MSDTGPTVDALIHLLAETPKEFLAEPVIRQRGAVMVEAVVNDLVMDLGGKPLRPGQLRHYRGASAKARNRLRLILVASWLLHDQWFREQARFAEPAEIWLRTGVYWQDTMERWAIQGGEGACEGVLLEKITW